jgi:hypothetical protein
MFCICRRKRAPALGHRAILGARPRARAKGRDNARRLLRGCGVEGSGDLIGEQRIPRSGLWCARCLLRMQSLITLVVDLYGMGYSEAPQVTYDANLFLSQLSMLLQYLKWDNVYLVGSSMGGAISASFAALFPWLVKDKVVLIACAGLVRVSDPHATGCMAAYYHC